MAISLRTLQRWRRQFTGDGDGRDRRKGSTRHVGHRLSQQEQQQILAVCNEPQYASLPPAQIVPALSDQGEFVASEISFYRVLHSHQQVRRRGRARPLRNRARCPGGVLMAPISSGAGTSPTCPRACGACGCTSTWWRTSGAARSSPGTFRTARTLSWPLI